MSSTTLNELRNSAFANQTPSPTPSKPLRDKPKAINRTVSRPHEHTTVATDVTSNEDTKLASNVDTKLNTELVSTEASTEKSSVEGNEGMKRRITVREGFEIYKDQQDALNALIIEEWQRVGKKPSKSGMIRDALDDYLNKRKLTAKDNAQR